MALLGQNLGKKYKLDTYMPSRANFVSILAAVFTEKSRGTFIREKGHLLEEIQEKCFVPGS